MLIYVLYKINTRTDLQIGDTIRNAANIYFDFNFPIMTNVAKTVVGFPTSTKNIDNYTTSELFPNPTNDILYLQLHEDLLKYEIFDIDGKVVKARISLISMRILMLVRLALLKVTTIDMTLGFYCEPWIM